jgi:DNA-binding response OmpR family regulator
MDKKKILVVDDEEVILNLIQKKLISNNYDCITASRAKDGLSLAKTAKPDLILLDIAMPDMDGYAVARDLKKEKTTRDIPIIFLTGKELDPQSINERIGVIGAYDFLMKPSTLEELLDKVKAAIGSV